jgi:hypothetical protein
LTAWGEERVSSSAAGILTATDHFWLFCLLIDEAGAASPRVITHVMPVAALVLGVAVLGESLSAGAVAGLVLIALGAWLATTGRAAAYAPGAAHPLPSVSPRTAGLDRGPLGSGPAHRARKRRPVQARRWIAMPRGSSPKRERQYEHIKKSARQRGEGTGRAEEIAARTVNKERARSGEAKTASRSSTQDMPSSRRGGQRSHRGAGGPTKAQLYAEARRRGVKGRSSMSKAQLARAVGR